MRRTGLALAILAILLLAGAAWAESDGGYDLSWSTVDAGGATFSAGGAYILGGTIGQPDAGALEAGDYRLAGGFWGAMVERYAVYLPVAVRS